MSRCGGKLVGAPAETRAGGLFDKRLTCQVEKPLLSNNHSFSSSYSVFFREQKKIGFLKAG